MPLTVCFKASGTDCPASQPHSFSKGALAPFPYSTVPSTAMRNTGFGFSEGNFARTFISSSARLRSAISVRKASLDSSSSPVCVSRRALTMRSSSGLGIDRAFGISGHSSTAVMTEDTAVTAFM